MKNNNNDFQLVKPKPKAINSSGLYNFLSNKQNRDWIQRAGLKEEDITFKADNGYIIINLDIKNIPEQNTITPISWHLRIDETYNYKKTFFAQWHCTLEFTDEKGQAKTLRAYYNNAVFLSIKIDGVDLTDSKMVNKMNDHFTYAKDTMLILLCELQSEQEKLQGKFDKEIAKLYAQDAVNFSDAYIERIFTNCKNAHQKMRIINEDVTQHAITFLEARIEFIKQRRHMLLSAQDNTSPIVEQISSAAVKSAQPKAKPKNAAAKLDQSKLNDFQQRIAKIKTDLETNDYATIISAHNSRELLKQEILALYESYPSDKEKLDDLVLDISILPDLNKLATDLLLKREFVAAQLLYRDGYGDRSSFFLGNIIAGCVNVKTISSELEQKYADFFAFLYEDSENYRVALSFFFNTLIHFKTHEVILGFNPLIQLAEHGKKQLFKLFYSQLQDTTLIGHRCGRRAADILSSLLHLSANNLDLVEFLIAKGHPCEHSAEHFSSLLKKTLERKNKEIRVFTFINWEPDEQFRALIEEKLLIEFRDFVAIPSAFYHACVSYHNSRTLKKGLFSSNIINLAKNTSTPYLILGLSVLLTRTTACLRAPTKADPSISIFSNQAQREQAIHERLREMEHGCKSISFIMLEENNPDLFQLMVTLIKIYNARIETIKADKQEKSFYDIHLFLSRILKQEEAIKQSLPAAASYNSMFFLYHARILTANLLPQTKGTYGMLQNAVKDYLQHLQGFNADQEASKNAQILLQQTLVGENIIKAWIAGYENLLENLINFNYWDRAEKQASRTPAYSLALAQQNTLTETASSTPNLKSRVVEEEEEEEEKQANQQQNPNRCRLA